MRALNIEDPDVLCRATDHIREQIDFIRDIEANGFAYRTSDGIYFDTSKQPDYGYLARLDMAGLEAGKRVELGEKRSITDFALWKFSTPGEQRQMEWESPWGTGFPGLAHRVLGHGAEVPRRLFRHPLRRRGPHPGPSHQRNRADARRGYGTRLANFWMHGYFLLSNDAKMAKSAGDFLRLQALVERGYDPLAYRYLCLTGALPHAAQFHLGRARRGRDGARRGCSRASMRLAQDPAVPPDAALLARFTADINDDLNLPRALAVAWETLRGDLAARGQACHARALRRRVRAGSRRVAARRGSRSCRRQGAGRCAPSRARGEELG